MSRHILRIFTVSLVLLALFGWIWSYIYSCGLAFGVRSHINMKTRMMERTGFGLETLLQQGTLTLRYYPDDPCFSGFRFLYRKGPIFNDDPSRFAGFGWGLNTPRGFYYKSFYWHYVHMPLYFPTLVFAVLFYFVLRKTRVAKFSGFPVILDSPRTSDNERQASLPAK